MTGYDNISISNKKKWDKLDFVKIKYFDAVKDAINGVKRQSTEWEKNFANHMSNQRLIPRI